MTHTEIIAMWPSDKILAEDIGAPYQIIRLWKNRKRIPGWWDVKFIEAARKRDLPLTFEIMARARARQSNEAA